LSLQDRDWYREDGGTRWSLGAFPAKWLLIAVTAGAFLVQAAAENGTEDGERFVRAHLALSLPGLRRWELWQPLTYGLLHADLFHLAMNMLGLFVFATVLEDRLTGPEVVRLYVLGILGGAAGHLLWALAGLPGGHAAVVGASGAVTALLVDAVLRAPSLPVNILVPVPLWVLGAIFVGIDAIKAVVRIAGGTGLDDIAVQAHLGGAATAAVLWLLRRRGSGRPRRRAAPRTRSLKDEFEAANTLPGPPSAGPGEEARVDALLERIHAEGMGSLSEEEREFLKRASERYRGRRR
jgi:membrane associated rhomboid family serine protease